MAERTVTFRMPALALLAAPACLAGAGLGLLELAARHRSAPVGSAGFYLVFLGVAMLVLNLLLRVQLSPAGVRIHAMRRSRLVDWAEVRAVTVEPHRRSGPRVTLWTASGGPVRLPLPMANKAWNEAAFLRAYHQVGQYWLATRGPGGAPTGWPPAEH